MHVVLIGAGRMGSGLAMNWLASGHRVTIFDPDSDFAQSLDENGATLCSTLSAAIESVPSPRVVWLMLPSGDATSETVKALTRLVIPGDLIVDGGNTFFRDSVETAASLQRSGIQYADVGTSGGILGRDLGYCMMVGGDSDTVLRLVPILNSGSAPAQWAHVGPCGSGHFAKMVHNGVEYALMQAYAEGVELLSTSAYSYDLGQLLSIWSNGSLIQSLLLSLLSESVGDGRFADFNEEVDDLGTGRWATLQAIHQDVPAPVITAALQSRLYSRRKDRLGWRLLSSLRHHFGGHVARGSKLVGPADG